MGRYNREKKAHRGRTKRSETMRSNRPAILAGRRETSAGFGGHESGPGCGARHPHLRVNRSRGLDRRVRHGFRVVRRTVVGRNVDVRECEQVDLRETSADDPVQVAVHP